MVLKLLWVLGATGLMISHGAQAASPSDKDMLLAFKQSFDNAASALPSWVNDTEPCDEWEGVICVGDQATAL